MTIGLVMALAVAAIAYADGVADNTPYVDGKVSPKKLDKKKYKPVKLFAGVRTEGPVTDNGCFAQTGGQCNPEAEFIEFGKNIKFKSGAAPYCTVSLAGQTTAQARAACEAEAPGSMLGEGTAIIQFPGAPNPDSRVTDETVTAFNGPGKNQLRLHAYSPTLTETNAVVVDGSIVKAKTAKYGSALEVLNAPDAAGDSAMIQEFNTTIEKKTGVVTARCKSKKHRYLRTVTYDDGSKETVELTQGCKRKKKSGGGGGGK